MKLSTVTLSYSTEVCREKGFSPAATKLGKSQSAVSTQIGLLEKAIAVGRLVICFRTLVPGH
jgi:DNA-binding transcriptional LysR family regulator